MKRYLVALFTVLAAADAVAQIHSITTTRSRNTSMGPGTFSIGPRYSNYSTDVEIGGATIESGRQHAFGLVGDYRSGDFVLDFLYDHDPENGISLADLLPINFGTYSRDRGEVTVGYMVMPQLAVQGGVRLDQVSIGGRAFNQGLFDNVDFDHQSLVVGAQFQTPSDKPGVGAWLLARGYVGTADFGDDIVGDGQRDTTGWRAEAGVSIPLGGSRWQLAPAVEIEHLETDDDFVTLDTNRLMINFIYTMR
jgi:hypothetical protein